jgi:multicomponent Na+:H+ antiporter subunit C
MTDFGLYALTGGLLFCIGWFGLVVQPHMLRKIIASNVMGTGVFLLLVAMAARGGTSTDPVPHAMVLTGIVVAVSATGVAIKLALHVQELTGRSTLSNGDEESDR